jgi:hypothetical protein
MKKQFTINRNGTFRTKLSVSNQCKAPGHRKYSYAIKATCGPKLDKNGFIIDHIELDRGVQAATKKISSCERLCESIADVIKIIISRNGANLLKVYIKVQPFTITKQPIAYMEYEVDYRR